MAFRIYDPQTNPISACARVDYGRFYLSMTTIARVPGMRVYFQPAKKGSPVVDVTDRFFQTSADVYPSVENIVIFHANSEKVLNELEP